MRSLMKIVCIAALPCPVASVPAGASTPPAANVGFEVVQAGSGDMPIAVAIWYPTSAR